MRRTAGAAGLATGLLAICMIATAAPASAAAYENSVGLATAGAYSVLAATSATNTGPSVLSGDLGVSPGTSATGFGGATIGGAQHITDAAAAQAQLDLTTAYNDAAGRTPTQTALGTALVGGTHQPGVYKAASSLNLGGAVILDGQGDPNAVFIFQIGASLTTDTGASIVLMGNAQACNVFWQVGASASLNTTNVFVGTIMALASITIDNGTTIAGRALASTGDVTLINDVFTAPTCATTPTTTTVTATPTTTGGTTTLTATVTASGASAPSGGTVTFSAGGTVLGTAPVGPTGVATLTVPAASVTGLPITAHFNGFGSFTASPASGTTTAVIDTPPLAATGAGRVTAMAGAAAALLAAGAGLLWAARGRRRHLSVDCAVR